MNLPEHDYQFASDADGRKILALLSYALHAADDLEVASPENTANLFVRLKEALRQLDALCQSNAALKENSFYVAQMENIRFTLETIAAAIEKNDKAIAASLAKVQLRCFLLELREEIYFWAYVHPWRERWDAYYREEFAAHHRNETIAQGCAAYEVSIFVPAKDKLEYTRQCVESILRETDKTKVNYELILINHGSRDNTQEYFESIPGAKLLHFKENVRMLMFPSALRVCEGKYAAFVSNDTMVTKDWLELLLRCIRSDPKIVSATPTTPNISNFQATPESYQNMGEMARFAEEFNRHDPLKWERRARVMPVIALYDIEKLNVIGFADRYFRTMEFWDDDLSLRARRAGYKQVLCRDVFCHHYGSVTGGEAQIKENTLQMGRELFVKKHGVDPWENGAFYDYAAYTRLQSMKLPDGLQAGILGIDCGFGDTPLQIANLLWKNKIDAQIDNVTLQRRYADDLKGVSRTFFLAEDELSLLKFLSAGLSGRQYDYIYLSQPLEGYMDWKELLDRLCDRLRPGGTLIFCLSNALDIVNFQWFGGLAFPPGRERLNYLNPDMVENHLKTRLTNVLRQQKRGWASAGLLTRLVKYVWNRGLPEEALIPILDTVGFLYFGTKKEFME